VTQETRNVDDLDRFFRRDPSLYAYHLGDLDPFFFPNTQWWKCGDAVLLLYTAFAIPVAQAVADNEDQGQLWRDLVPQLPHRLYVHFQMRHAPVIEERYSIRSFGRHLRMAWEPDASADPGEHKGLRVLTPEDLKDIRALYRDAFPEAHFDPRTLDVGMTMGVFDGDRLASVATCHVFSKTRSVAALGAIATHPDFRGRGLGTVVTYALAKRAAEQVDFVGLNVRAGNKTAVGIYERLGFRARHEYEEGIFEASNP
jgi:ribosomal protein S18 acetylase RimI-like enzyme